MNPIHVDSTATAESFKNTPQGKVLIRKMFYTIQGEGPFTGQPAVFVRLGGCNFGGKGIAGPGCPWCDTDFRMSESELMDIPAITAQIKRLWPFNARPFVVITGGEPMLQQNLLPLLMDTTMLFQIESNGTRLIQGLPLTGVFLVVSPKIPEMQGKATGTYPPLQDVVLGRADALKFIVSADPDSPYHDIPQYAFNYMRDPKKVIKKVFISPMAVYKKAPSETASIWDPQVYDHRKCAENHAYAAELVMKHGFILSVQSHLYCKIP